MNPNLSGCCVQNGLQEGKSASREATEIVWVRDDGGSNQGDGGREDWEHLEDILEVKLTFLDDKFAANWKLGGYLLTSGKLLDLVGFDFPW